MGIRFVSGAGRNQSCDVWHRVSGYWERIFSHLWRADGVTNGYICHLGHDVSVSWHRCFQVALPLGALSDGCNEGPFYLSR